MTWLNFPMLPEWLDFFGFPAISGHFRLRGWIFRFPGHFRLSVWIFSFPGHFRSFPLTF